MQDPPRGPIRRRRHPRVAVHVRRLLVGERRGRRLLFRGTVEWGIGLRTAKEILQRGREIRSSPFDDFTISRAVTWLEPMLVVEVTYSEIMDGRLRDPVYRGLA